MNESGIKLSEQIRQAIDAAPMSRYRICKAVGLSEATMSRFMSGQGGLSLQKLDAIAELLGWRIEVSRPQGGKAKADER